MSPVEDPRQSLTSYPLLEALRGRRSRRFGLGMKIGAGPLAYESRHDPLPLLEDEEAALAFAACGVTGYALADLSYGTGQGGSMLAGLVGRTIASADAVNAVAVAITNDQATYLLKRPQDFTAAEIPELVDLAGRGELTELYRRSRIKIKDGRAAPPVAPGANFNINRWSLYAPGGTYILPINDVTTLYINGLLEAFDETMGLFVVDERAGFRPAGLARFGKNKGGHLNNNPRDGRLVTIQILESALVKGVAVEQGMVMQNVGLMAQALGLGGFPNFAPHEYTWFKELGFNLGQMPASRYLGAPRLVSTILGWLGRDAPVPFPLGLEREGTVLLKPYCPPYFSSMQAAVRALVEAKFGPQGIFRGRAGTSAWRDPEATGEGIPGISERAIEATIAYCEYIYQRYGRFPAYGAPFHTISGYQATHVDVEFYDRFYQPGALTETQRGHMGAWHPASEVTQEIPAPPQPQLQMIWPERLLSAPPEVVVPEGYELRNYTDDDEAGYIEVMDKAGFHGWDRERVERVKRRVLPDGFFVMVHKPSGRVVATAIANHAPRDEYPYGGELGWVAADPDHKGRGLGTGVCAAVIGRLIAAGYRNIYLLTDDFRLPAINVYLKLGFEPDMLDDEVAKRWEVIHRQFAQR